MSPPLKMEIIVEFWNNTPIIRGNRRLKVNTGNIGNAFLFTFSMLNSNFVVILSLVREFSICWMYSRIPVDSILLAVFTVSPNKQYLGIVSPTTPEHARDKNHQFHKYQTSKNFFEHVSQV